MKKSTNTMHIPSVKKAKIFALLYLFSSLLLGFSCSKDATTEANEEESENDGQIETEGSTEEDPLIYNPDWTEISHGEATPDYSTVFPQNEVNKIEITMTSTQWQAIRTNMTSLYGYDFGSNGSSGGDFEDENPDYVDVSLSYNGTEWKNVGFRLKGNSSLTSIWGEGNYKLPFKLDMDEFEDSYPATKNQRFYGFKKISFSPAYKDQSLMRERLTPEIFKMAGISAAETAFYAVYIDFGSGSKYCGVYTAVENIHDTMIANAFGEDNENIYKPESTFSSFNSSEFEKKNNEDEADFSDVQAFITALTSSLRTSDAVQWRTNLEATFDVDYFLKYLAVNNGIVNWDSYGVMAHNHYLYNHPNNLLTWIPWDHNEALEGSPGITETSNSGGGGGHSPISLSMNEVTSSWPLLYNIANDAVYMAQYQDYLQEFNEEDLNQASVEALIDGYYNLISPYAIGADGEQNGYSHLNSDASFTSAISELKNHISDRKSLISTYVP